MYSFSEINLLVFAKRFWSWFLIDIIGDQTGWRKAIWVMVVMVGSAGFIFMWNWWRYYVRTKEWKRTDEREYGSEMTVRNTFAHNRKTDQITDLRTFFTL